MNFTVKGSGFRENKIPYDFCTHKKPIDPSQMCVCVSLHVYAHVHALTCVQMLPRGSPSQQLWPSWKRPHLLQQSAGIWLSLAQPLTHPIQPQHLVHPHKTLLQVESWWGVMSKSCYGSVWVGSQQWAYGTKAGACDGIHCLYPIRPFYELKARLPGLHLPHRGKQ